ncbi:protein of unknown function DUF839 [[Leptolyngbya] sp. PCC 7376]|uniref:PhoX family protein n=1 Tax=[Leptolyngbya] sp. PCC 7376 TaxID=111781 RepID=UPI00029F1222|nr:PhoX family phosphatase [[Leptolyngbya] sp. PCC 7376]AFY37560.1 protein of unknown function DUF839 [[Leptolyngbya] sp. PCC 7376]
MPHDNKPSNFSGNRPFHDVLQKRISRRNMLKKSMILSAAGFVGAIAGENLLRQTPVTAKTSAAAKKVAKGSSPLIEFDAVPVAAGNGSVPTISADYEYQALIPWGTALTNEYDDWDGNPATRPTSAQQAKMIGIGHDGMTFFPFRGQTNHGLIAVNHEFGRNTHVLGKSAPETLEDVLLSQHAHGVSVVEVKANPQGVWEVVKNSAYNRRVHVNTPVTFSGPVAGDSLLDTPQGNSPKGTVNNCANGFTPWRTYLTCEENFNGYFGANGNWTPTAEQTRYGFSSSGFGYGWQNFDDRFDLSNSRYRNEDNRFGWVVEIDPMSPDKPPVKRTALGRFKHEGVGVTVGRGGRVVCYMGDDQRFDYIYKFVSAANWKRMIKQGKSPLDEGTLYVARFNDDGTGDWLELTINDPKLAAKFSSQAEVLTYARLAADELGATPMDRPEWTTVAPDGTVYCSLTNNSRRTTDDPTGANPIELDEFGNPLRDSDGDIVGNPDGHIMSWVDSNRHTGITFEWDIFVLSRDTRNTESVFSDPDGLWADPDGRLFIQTDGGQKDSLNNQMLVADPKTHEIRRLFTGVTSDEITGIAVTPDRKTMFINTQHPGNGDPSRTNFPVENNPANPNGPIPRDSTIVIKRKDGGIVGS